MIENKIVVFEEINSATYPIVDKYLIDGFIVYFIAIDDGLLNKPLVKSSLKDKKLVDLSQIIFDHTLYSKAACHAHENLDHMFGKYFSHSLSIKITSDLLQSDEIQNMYRKGLLLNLIELYLFELKINEIAKNNINEIDFYPAGNFDIHSDQKSPLLGNIRVMKCKNIKFKLKNIFDELRSIALLFYPFYILIRKTKWISIKNKAQTKFKIGINANLPNLFGYNYHYINYIVDDIYGTQQNDILFIDETYEAQNADECGRHGYTHVNFKYKKEVMSLKFISNLFGFFIPGWIKCFIHSFREDKIIINTTRVILTDYIKWNIFVDNYSIDNHITILLPDNISKNIILSRNGVKTWHIYPDNYSNDYHSGWGEKIRTSIYSFMRVDNAIVYGEKIVRFFSYHRNNVKKYVRVGVLPSQRIHELREGKLASNLPHIIKKKNLYQKCQKIIAVFDTSFVDYGVLKIKDGIRFGEDILRLLDEMPEIGVIFKEKKHLSVTPQLAPVYEKLEKHDRCVVVRKTETDCIFSTEVIALSDLVISAAYTSTNAEALGAKTKAIYYDVAGTDIGDNYYFNKFPNFVAHNYDELKRLVKYWLYEVNDEKFEEFLNTYVKGELDPYLDGKAIDRLQALLRNS